MTACIAFLHYLPAPVRSVPNARYACSGAWTDSPATNGKRQFLASTHDPSIFVPESSLGHP